MLNTILYSNTFEDYFTYQINDRILNLYFNSNYRTANLKETYYKHLAWILGNRDIADMIDEIGYNTSIENQMKFQFKIPNFKFTARVKKTKYGYLVMEIIKVKEKRINFDEIKVFHQSFEKYEKSDKAKKWSYVNLNNNKNNERKINNEADGSTRTAESIKDELTIQEYLGVPEIKKEKTGYVNKRQVEDKNTKKFLKEDTNKRTFTDEGGQSLDKGIEANSIYVKSINGHLKDFMQILKYLKNRRRVSSVSVKVVELPIVFNRRFTYLSDGIMEISIDRYKHLKKSNYEKACDIYFRISKTTSS